MENNRFAFALGMAQKAGKAVSGDFAVRSSLKSGKVKLLVIAADTAPNTKKDLYFMAQQFHVETVEMGTKAELGLAIGKAQRTAVAITDINFAKMLAKK